jgi:hypothetical protein
MHKPDAPSNIATLAAGLRTSLGQHERALENLRQIILTTDDSEAQEKLIRTYRGLAGKEFPEEAMRVKEELQRGWMAELPFASPDMYVVLGARPPAAFDLNALAAEQSVFSTLLDDEPAPDEVATDEDATDKDAAEDASDAASAGHASPPPGADAGAAMPAERGIRATPVP